MLRVLMVKLPWLAVLVTLAAAVVLLFGPLWTSAAGENPLDRPSGVDYALVLRLGLPTIMVLAALATAIAGRAWWGTVAVLVFGYALWAAPAPLSAWFLPGLVLSVVGYCWGLLTGVRPQDGRSAPARPLDRAPGSPR